MQKWVSFLLVLLFLTSCGKEEEKSQEETLSPVQEEIKKSDLEVTPVSFKELQNWGSDDLSSAMSAFSLSCNKIMERKDPFLSQRALIKVPTAAYQEVCQKLANVAPLEYKNFIEQNFVPYRVRFKGSDIGKFTSYFEPTISVSSQKDEYFKIPVYGRPYDMFELNLSEFGEDLPKRKLVGRIVGQNFVPYYTREEINKIYMKAPIILWTNDAVDLFIAQIQGSAVALMPDGSQVRLAFDGSNGRKFTGIGSILLQKGLIRPGQASMMEIKKWMKENFSTAKKLMNLNERFVFHRLSYESGPIGAQGVVLTAGRSLAVDPDFIPLGSLLWLETSLPKFGETAKMVVAQDVGSAIKGAIRGDYFWGTGSDDVLELAGKMNAEGRYYILVPKGVEVDF